MSAPQGNFQCVCGGSYVSQARLRQHQRRYCRGPPSNNEGRCPVCNAEFNSFKGMRLHMQKQHPEEYNMDLETESSGARTAWTKDEEDELAKAEAAYTGKDIYGYLLTISNRTRDALKSRRRLQSYKDKVVGYREELQPPTPINPSTEEEAQVTNANGIIRTAIEDIESEKLNEATAELRNRLLHDPPEAARAALDAWYSSTINTYSRRRRNRRETNQGPRNLENIKRALQQNTNRRKKRRLEYRAAQHLFLNDQKAYAERLLDGRDLFSDGAEPNTEELVAACSELFSTPSTEDLETVKVVNQEVQMISHPITTNEIEAAIKTSKSDAAGYDGLSLSELKRIPKHHLMLFYNGMLLTGHTPSDLKKGRTILIPKKDDDLHLVTNWRPITISSVIARTFNKILAGRLANVPMNSCQRGFNKIDGCFANYATLETTIKSRRKKGQPLTLVFLDLSKAFDMISHQSINRALNRLNIDPKTRNFIVDSYNDCSTTVFCGSKNIGTFAVKRGVKQGDPHSPFIFNAVIDELLTNLQDKSGIPIGPNSKLSALAYADDIVIAATNISDAQRMLNEAKEFFERRGLRINVSKCISLITNTVPGKKKVFVATEPKLYIGEEQIPVTSLGNTFSYLGQKFSTFGLSPCTSDALNSQICRIQRAPLKPQQKLCIINKYLIPRYIASVQRPNINKKILKGIDKKIRGAIRKILSLFQHCSNSIFYAACKDGGLGIFSFTANIPRIILGRWEKIRITSHLAEDVYRASQAWVTRLRRLIPTEAGTKKDVQQNFSEELQQSISGNLQDAHNHPACRRFIHTPPKYWSGRDYIKAIHLRYNLLPCRGIPSNPPNERTCRGCNQRTETISHILQRCPISHFNRIKRHNFVAKRIKTAATLNGWNVEMEPHIRGTDGVLKKPDLLMRKGNKVVISDVGIHWEGQTSLEDQFLHKVAVYSSPSFAQKVQELYPNCTIMVLPVIVGARGTWCTANRGLLRELELTFDQVQDIITTTLRGGWIIHDDFMRFVWRRRQGNNNNNA